MDEKPICRKCLLEDFADEEYLSNMRAYLKGLDREIKAEEDIYQSRLDTCRSCDYLNEGICKLCGCFVEYRAAMKAKACPDIQPRW